MKSPIPILLGGAALLFLMGKKKPHWGEREPASKWCDLAPNPFPSKHLALFDGYGAYKQGYRSNFTLSKQEVLDLKPDDEVAMIVLGSDTSFMGPTRTSDTELIKGKYWVWPMKFDKWKSSPIYSPGSKVATGARWHANLYPLCPGPFSSHTPDILNLLTPDWASFYANSKDEAAMKASKSLFHPGKIPKPT